MNMTINAAGCLSSSAAQALIGAAIDEAACRGPLTLAAVDLAVTELLPFWREWDARGGFAEGADHAALFAAWERAPE